RKSTPVPAGVTGKSFLSLTMPWLLSTPDSCSGRTVAVTVLVTTLGEAWGERLLSLSVHEVSPTIRKGTISNVIHRKEGIWDFLMWSIPSHRVCHLKIRYPRERVNLTLSAQCGCCQSHCRVQRL